MRIGEGCCARAIQSERESAMRGGCRRVVGIDIGTGERSVQREHRSTLIDRIVTGKLARIAQQCFALGGIEPQCIRITADGREQSDGLVVATMLGPVGKQEIFHGARNVSEPSEV